MSVAGPYVTCSSGGGDVVGLAHDIVLPRSLRFGVADSADEVRRVVREILHGGADFIKVIATGAVLTRGTSSGAPEFTETEIRAAVEGGDPPRPRPCPRAADQDGRRTGYDRSSTGR